MLYLRHRALWSYWRLKKHSHADQFRMNRLREEPGHPCLKTPSFPNCRPHSRSAIARGCSARARCRFCIADRYAEPGLSKSPGPCCCTVFHNRDSAWNLCLRTMKPSSSYFVSKVNSFGFPPSNCHGHSWQGGCPTDGQCCTGDCYRECEIGLWVTGIHFVRRKRRIDARSTAKKLATVSLALDLLPPKHKRAYIPAAKNISRSNSAAPLHSDGQLSAINEPARQVLARLLSAVSNSAVRSPAAPTMAYSLLCDPATKQYAFNVHTILGCLVCCI